MNEEYGAVYRELYERHWWWRSRERILLDVIGRLDLPKPETGRPRILDVGCGDGLFFPQLRRFGDPWGVETDRSLISDDNPDRDRIHADLPAVLAERGERFELITALDVIEHIEDDASAVEGMASLLSPGGKLLVTVPAFMSLWDDHDVINQHYRRYTQKTLRRVLEPHGEVVQIRYLFHAIFIPKILIAWRNRLGQKLGGESVPQHGIPSDGVNRLVTQWCALEARICRKMPVPFGTSVMAVLQRR